MNILSWFFLLCILIGLYIMNNFANFNSNYDSYKAKQKGTRSSIKRCFVVASFGEQISWRQLVKFFKVIFKKSVSFSLFFPSKTSSTVESSAWLTLRYSSASLWPHFKYDQVSFLYPEIWKLFPKVTQNTWKYCKIQNCFTGATTFCTWGCFGWMWPVSI